MPIQESVYRSCPGHRLVRVRMIGRFLSTIVLSLAIYKVVEAQAPGKDLEERSALAIGMRATKDVDDDRALLACKRL